MREPVTKDSSVVEPDMHEYHTGHLPKPKLPTVTGAVDSRAVPQKAEFSVMSSVAPQPQRAILWVPPITHYSLHYQRVDNYAVDLSNAIYDDRFGD